MRIDFTKMNGAGNDFVMIDNRDGRVRLSSTHIQALCDRRRGIGADGIILLESAADVDFRMRYYNRDGGEAEMCGNGARCVARFAESLGLGERRDDGTHLRFATIPGLMGAAVGESTVTIEMTDATSFEKSTSLMVAGVEEIVHVIDTGVPHVVIEASDVDSMTKAEIEKRGSAIRYHERFAPAGTNVNFVSVAGDGRVKIRTYERGVEAETLACGTGAVAGAVVSARLRDTEGPITMVTRGQEELMVSFTATPGGASHVRLTGPADVNYRGSITLSLGRGTDGV